MDIRKVFANNLKERRLELGLSQEELAHRADLDRTYISSLEHCKYSVSIDVLDRLAKELKTDCATLLK